MCVNAKNCRGVEAKVDKWDEAEVGSYMYCHIIVACKVLCMFFAELVLTRTSKIRDCMDAAKRSNDWL